MPSSSLDRLTQLTPVTVTLCVTYPDTYPDVIPEMRLEEIDEELGELREGESEAVIEQLSAVVSPQHMSPSLPSGATQTQ